MISPQNWDRKALNFDLSIFGQQSCLASWNEANSFEDSIRF